MNWQVSFTTNSLKFLSANSITKEEIFELITLSVKRFRGENINVDIKKLKGVWAGFYRIRKGKLRIIVEFDFDNASVLVEEIDWRGSAYKN